MRSRTTLAAAALLPWLGIAAGPSPMQPSAPEAQQDRPRREAPLPPRTPDPRLGDLNGAWELTSISDPLLGDPQIRHSGMMLIADGYLSFELHLGVVESTANRLLESYFQSGVHRFEVDSLGKLVLDGILGAEVDTEGFLLFEPPGRRRLYRFDVSKEELTLNRLDRRARLVFRRVQHRPTQKDIYGREVVIEPEEESER